LRQEVQVFDTASGSSVLSVIVSPAVTTGQNVSLSPDGRRLALLQGSMLELFDLASMSEEEQAKFATLKSDIPGLYTVGSNADTDSAIENASPAANSAEAATLTADAPASATVEETPDSHTTAHAEENVQPPSGVSTSPSPSTVTDTAEKNSTATNPPVTTFKVSSKAVVVDVVVTDSKGHPIRGLSQQDFQITEDKKPQDIRYYREFTESEPSAPSSSGPMSASQAGSALSVSATPQATPAAPAPSPNVFNNRAQGSQAGAITMVLFDMLNTPPQDQAYARLQLIKFLQSKPKISQFALSTLSSGEYPLRLIQGFTADETVLLASAKGKNGQPRNNRWQASAAEARNSVATVSALALEGRTSGFQNLVGALQEMQEDQYVTDTSERAARTIDSMMLLARYLSGVSGRKNIVWLSASFPITITIGPLSNNPSISNANYTYKIKRATNLLADAQVAVYPVDIRGLQVFTADLGAGVGVAGLRSFEPPDPTSPTSVAARSAIPQGMGFSEQAAEQDTLTQFAVATGGKAFFNTNDIREAIATANEQGSNYYSFSYSPSNKVYDGKFRKIKVQLAERGYKLYYRQGYYADDVNVAAKEAQLARNAIATAMHYGSPPAREVPFSVRVYPVGGKKKVDRAKIGEVLVASRKAPPLPAQVEVQHYVIDYTLDGSDIRFVPQQNAAFRNSLALMITSFGQEGRMLTGWSSLAQSDLPPEVYKKVITGDVGFQEEVDIPVDAISMRLGVQDQMSNHLGTVDVQLPVPPDPNAPRKAKIPLPEIEPD
jgi:VWFA-related protein